MFVVQSAVWFCLGVVFVIVKRNKHSRTLFEYFLFPVRFFDRLVGRSQVFLLNQPVCGFIILIALGLSSWTMAGFCVFGTICSTFTAMFLLHPAGDKVKEPLFEPSTMLGLYVGDVSGT
jgi:hypothetical protein